MYKKFLIWKVLLPSDILDHNSHHPSIENEGLKLMDKNKLFQFYPIFFLIVIKIQIEINFFILPYIHYKNNNI